MDMYYKKISIFGYERFFTAICIAVSAINLIVSFLVAGYWYDKSTVIPYPVLLIISFILLEFILYAVINAMSEIGSQLDKKNVKIQKASQEKEDVTISIPETSKSAISVPNKDVQDNAISVESEQEEPVSPKATEDLSAPEVPLVVSQASVERSESITKLLNLSAEEKRKKREKFIQGRKELMEAYIRGIMKPLLPEADIDALWLEYKQWIESSTYQPTSRMWKWKEKVTSRDVRHLTWNIAKRMGMENGYGTKNCGRFIKTMFPDLCIKRDGSQCTEDYLANNLLEEKDTDFIKIDKPDPNSIAFHFGEKQIKQVN
jgi:NACalpha-BTF3-like transcription factor